MTAIADISAAIRAARPPRQGHKRHVVIGLSALTAVYAEHKALRDHADPRIEGITMTATDQFRGWALRDFDGEDWHDVGPR